MVKNWILKLNQIKIAPAVSRQHLMISSERKFHLESGDVWLLGTIVQTWFYEENKFKMTDQEKG